MVCPFATSGIRNAGPLPVISCCQRAIGSDRKTPVYSRCLAPPQPNRAARSVFEFVHCSNFGHWPLFVAPQGQLPSCAMAAPSGSSDTALPLVSKASTGSLGLDTGGASAHNEVVIKARCCMECGPPQPLTYLMRTSPRAQPICNPCYNSQRAISVAAATDPQAKAIMDKYRIADPEGWKAKVLALAASVRWGAHCVRPLGCRMTSTAIWPLSRR